MRAVRSLPKWARAGILATAASGSIAGLAVAALPSGASVSATTVYNATGWAGYYSTPNAHRMSNGDRVTGVRTQFYLRQRAETTAVNLGVELCRPQSNAVFNSHIFSVPGDVVVVFTKYIGNGLFGVYANNLTSSNCFNAIGNTSGAQQIDTVPAGHTVYLAISTSRHGFVTYTDEDLSNNTGGNTGFAGFGFGYLLAGVGTNGNQSSLTEPANNKLAGFTQTAVRDGTHSQNNGWATINRSGLTRMVITKVVDTTTGTSAPPVLLQPVNLMTNGFTIDSGNLSGV